MSGINQREMLVGVDIGTSKVVAVVAEITPEDNIEIIGLGTQPSRGLRNGVVVDIESTTHAIKKSIQEAESMAGCHISSCYVGISGSHIRGLNSEDPGVPSGTICPSVVNPVPEFTSPSSIAHTDECSSPRIFIPPNTPNDLHTHL